ncbi:type 1 fimbriae major subunit FimA [Escherichia coli]|nr:type 1 fimbriae major subunit FimA [Escherichia coli]
MKIKTLAIVVLSALSLSSAAALADTTTVNGGTVHFKGEVVNAACAVDAGSVDQTVQLGQVRTASLAQEGATSSAVGFNIQLNDCDTTVADKAAIAFLGTAIDGTHPNVLALQSSAAGSATKVGVQILDRTGAALALDGATFSAQTTLNNGTVSVSVVRFPLPASMTLPVILKILQMKAPAALSMPIICVPSVCLTWVLLMSQVTQITLPLSN